MPVRGKRWVALVALVALSPACSSEEGGTADGRDAAAAGGGAGTGAAAGAGGAGTGGAAGWPSGGAAGAAAGGAAGSGASGGSGGTVAPYLVSIDHFSSPTTLLKIDVQTGVGKIACTLPSSVNAINYPSSTFSRGGILFASNYQDGRLDRIDPCTCAVTPIGKTGFNVIPGITANKTSGLLGIETEVDILLDLNPTTGAGTKIGDLSADFTTGGATWSDALNAGQGGLYGINGATNQLYTINPTTGAATAVVAITGVSLLNSVGVELHPGNGVLYACTDDAVLYSINPTTGVATAIGTGMGHTPPCNNLAAPWVKVACLDAL